MKKVGIVFSYPLCIRNFIHSGLLHRMKQSGMDIRILSPYEIPVFRDQWGNEFHNTYVPTKGKDQWGTPLIQGAGKFFTLLFSIRLRGYAIEYPNGSLQTMDVSKPNSATWYISFLLVKLFPRKSRGRRVLRKIYDRLGPSNDQIEGFIDNEKPDVLITSTMGHFAFDFISMTLAIRRGIKTICVLHSWDNLYSRGCAYKHPDKLLVWSKIMKQQALNVHQFADEDVKVVGPLQFVNYAEPVTTAELDAVRTKLKLTPQDKCILYMCGGRTPQYDIEDIREVVKVIRNSKFRDYKIIVRPHPQVDPKHYDAVKDLVLLDYSPYLIAFEDPETLFSKADVRHMAALLSIGDYIISSWGTTALLEACLFDKKVVQLNWFDSVEHQNQAQREMVRNFQKYYHMKEFDAYNPRLFSNEPADLASKFEELDANESYFSKNWRRVEEDFTTGEFDKVTEKINTEVLAVLK